MVDRIIVSYLSGNKRLVIPGFGAFLRKDPAGVVFVEFLKNDDGVLNSLLCEEMGVSADEATAIVGNFVTTINRRLHTNGSYVIEGLGELVMNANGVCDLQYNPEQKSVPMATPEKAVMSGVKPTMDSRATVSANTSELNGGVHEERPSRPVVSAQSVVNQVVSKPAVNLRSTPQTQQPIQKSVRPEQNVGSPSMNINSQSNDRPIVKPVADAQARVSKPSDVTSATTGQRVVQPRNNNYNSEYVKPKKKTDVVMVMAIIVSIIAVISLLYGVFSNGAHVKNLLNDSDSTNDVQVEQVDETVEETPSAPQK